MPWCLQSYTNNLKTCWRDTLTDGRIVSQPTSDDINAFHFEQCADTNNTFVFRVNNFVFFLLLYLDEIWVKFLAFFCYVNSILDNATLRLTVRKWMCVCLMAFGQRRIAGGSAHAFSAKKMRRLKAAIIQHKYLSMYVPIYKFLCTNKWLCILEFVSGKSVKNNKTWIGEPKQ